MAQRLQHATDNRVLMRSNPTEAVWKLLQFPLPHFASVLQGLQGKERGSKGGKEGGRDSEGGSEGLRGREGGREGGIVYILKF